MGGAQFSGRPGAGVAPFVAPVRRIVVGTDGSEDSLRAVAWAGQLARSVGAEVIAVHAVGLLEEWAGNERSGHAMRRDAITEEFERSWCAPLATLGVDARHVVRDGPAVEVLLAVADETEADLVAVGSRGLGGLARPFLGSTSHRLAAASTCPVVIVPPVDEAAGVAPGS